MTRVVVVGAGILGAAVADSLASRGAAVTVVDAGLPGGGTSGRSFAWVNAQDKQPSTYFDLNVAGVAEHRRLAATLGGDWYHPGGDLVIGSGAAAAAVHDRIERHRALGYPVRELDARSIAALEPAIELGPEPPIAGAHFPDEAWVDVVPLVARLLDRARESGARVHPRTAVVAIERRGARVSALVTRDGERRRPDVVVLAAGPATGSLAALAGITIPMAPSRGLLGITAPTPVAVGRVVHALGTVTVRPDSGGRLMLASPATDRLLADAAGDERSAGDETSAGAGVGLERIDPDSGPCRELVARARHLLPGLGDGSLEAARIGIRSVPADGLPVAGFAPGLENLYVLAGHSGVTLAPAIGPLAAGEVLGTPADALAPYRPTRFSPAGGTR